MARSVCFNSEELKPVVVMVIVQLAFAGSNFMYTIAMADGMGIQTLTLYKLLFATVFMAPIAFFSERNCRPRFTWMIALEGILSGLFGATLGNYLYAKSMSLTSTAFVTAMGNLIPGLTLVLALIFSKSVIGLSPVALAKICFLLALSASIDHFNLIHTGIFFQVLQMFENLDIRNSAGKAKVLGIVLGIGGAMILTFVKGKKIKIWSDRVDIIPRDNHSSVPSNNAVGSLLAFLSSLSYAIWLVLQTKMSHSYPCYSSTALMCFTGSILTGVLAIFTERELSSWMLGWNCRLLAVAYLGIVSSGISVAAVCWSSMMKGPLFVSSFAPLGLVFTALAGSLFLREELCLGSLIGSTLSTIGIYLVIWGKGKEATASQDGETESRRDEVSDGNQAPPPIVPGQCTDYQTNRVQQKFKHEHVLQSQ